jgi:Mg2+ and Co2+ transporter CorA
VGKVIQFPLITEATRLVEELQVQEEEIKMCLDDLQSLNEHIVELTMEYEELLNRLCTINNIKLPEEGDNND